MSLGGRPIPQLLITTFTKPPPPPPFTSRPPAFLAGLGRLVITKCRTILRPLNKLQQRALLRVMMAEDYLLIRACPALVGGWGGGGVRSGGYGTKHARYGTVQNMHIMERCACFV